MHRFLIPLSWDNKHVADLSEMVKDIKHTELLSEDTYPVSNVPGMFEAFSSVIKTVKYVLLGFQCSVFSSTRRADLLYVTSLCLKGQSGLY